MLNTTARIHEFNGTVALRIGDGLTTYLTPALALALSEKLPLAAFNAEGDKQNFEE